VNRAPTSYVLIIRYWSHIYDAYVVHDGTEVMPINMDSKIVMDKYVQCQCCTDQSRTP
jgi:hypothetical protein